MPSPSLKILDDLVPEIKGEIDISLPTRVAYSYSACIYRILPLAVIKPRDPTDVAKVIRYASDSGFPVTARGGGSGVAGHSVGSGIILDFSCYMHKIIEQEENWVLVEPGVVLDSLNAYLAIRGKKFAPDPSSSAYCTVGGMLANNSSGAKGLKYRSTREHVVDLEVVTAEGEIVWLSSFSSWKEAKIVQLAPVFSHHKKDIEEAKPKVSKNSCGYDLWDVRQNGELDIKQLIVGSEGTLAIVTRAKLKLIDIPKISQVFLFYFDTLKEAVSAVPALREKNPSAIEVMDERFLKIVRNSCPELKELIPSQNSCLLLIEVEANDTGELREKSEDIERIGRNGGAYQIVTATDESTAKKLWKIRKAGSPIISSVRGSKRPIRFVEDVIVPPENLAEFTEEFMGILRRYDCEAPVIGHAGDGNLHVNPILDLSDPAIKTTIKKVADDVYSLVDKYHGSLTAEHGVGRLRSPYLERHYGKKIYDIFLAIKNVFDPKGILNSSVIIGNDDITANLRFESSAKKFFQLPYFDIRETLNRCHGCGECRQFCPSYEVFRSEEYSPRGRINIVRGAIDGPLNIESLKSDENLANLLSACLICDRCASACSSEVYVSSLVATLKGKMVPKGLQKYRDKLLANPRKGMFSISKIRSLISPRSKETIEFLASNGALNKLFCALTALNPDKPLSIPQGVNLKRIAPFFMQEEGEEIVYFPGCFATFIDPIGTGKSLFFVLKSMGYKPIVPSFACCGMPFFASGDIERAFSTLASVCAQLEKTAPLTIITSCPSCAQMLRGEIIEIPQAVKLRERVQSAESFMAKIISGEIVLPHPPVFAPVEMSVVLQKPCHQTFEDMEAMKKILQEIPTLQITALPDVCCGMGGVAGLKKENRDFSAKVSERLVDKFKKVQSEVIVSVCGSCRVGLSKFAVNYHPLLLIAKSMGFKGN